MNYLLPALGALLAWGAWGVFVKIVSRQMTGEALLFWTTIGALPVVLVYVARQGSFRWSVGSELAVLAGVCSAFATACFYASLRTGPASVVFPLTGMYILIPAAFGFVLFNEPVTLRHVLGMVCAGAAILFLSK
ncbi:MAG: DMT family transporter [candidate division WOR-3 bacterium]